MDDRRMEERLREVPLAEPPPELRGRIMREAAARTRRSRWTARLQWALAAAAALLIAANLVFAHVHDARMAELMGGSQAAVAERTPIDAEAYAQAIQERERLMSEMLGDAHIDTDGGEPNGARQLPDLQTNWPSHRRVECA
ncbi:MAG: hypothetical protein ACOX9R_11970 [Armatimonadota bacterium]|jgi:hypothetical protein